MIYLKIYNNKGYFRVDGTCEKWTELDQIGKDDLLRLIEKATTEEFQMNEYRDELLQNPAHNILYKNIYSKFSELLNNKTRFQDSVNAMYKTAIDKYSTELSVASEDENTCT